MAAVGDNQSTDLRGAIIAMANATGKEKYVKPCPQESVCTWWHLLLTNLFRWWRCLLPFVNKGENANFVQSLKIVGGCTGKEIDGKEEQDFSNPSVIIENPAKKGQTNVLLNITTNGKPVTLSGFTFTNESGMGVKALINKDNGGTGNELVIHHSSFPT